MDRTRGIGGTDIGAIIGVNPWRGPMDVYLEKVGITEGQPDNEAMYWGREMEPVLLKRYVKEIGITEVFVPQPDELPYIHPKYYWYLGSPDGIVAGNGGVDFKTTGHRNGWGQPGTDEVPDWIHTQADWYMGLTDAKWWDIAVLFFSPRREFAIYRIPRNQELIDNLIEAGKDFWLNHVVPRIPPEIDASSASQTLLRHLYPDSKGEVLAAPSNALDWRIRLEKANQEIKQWEEEKKLAQHHLEALVGDADSLLWSDGARFDWKKQKDRIIIDWENLAMSFLPTKEQINTFTTIKPGPRVPRLWPAKEEK